MDYDFRAPILDAIAAAATAAGLGRQLVPPCTGQAISQWIKCPPHRVLQVEAATGVSRYRLRPDIYGSAPEGVVATTGEAA